MGVHSSLGLDPEKACILCLNDICLMLEGKQIGKLCFSGLNQYTLEIMYILLWSTLKYLRVKKIEYHVPHIQFNAWPRLAVRVGKGVGEIKDSRATDVACSTPRRECLVFSLVS